MPHPIIEIDELLRLIIDELVEASPRTAVSFALTCRSLEEPTLSSLWRKQRSLYFLLEVLPGCALAEGEHGFDDTTIEHYPSAEDWARLQRYASWMRRLHLGLDEDSTSDVLSQLSSNSPDGLLFPNLEWLHWNVCEADTALAFFRLFLSPNLQCVTLYTHYNLFDIPWSQLAALVQIISVLPTSLEYLSVMCGQGKEEPLRDAVSSFVCRCGPLLRSFGTCVPLSEAAIYHLMQLPNLSHWTTAQGPPQVVPTSIFPSLERVRLDKPRALPWLHLLASHERGILRNGSVSATSHTNIRETLKSLDCPWGTIVDSILLSSIVEFRNLVTLRVRAYYCSDADAGSCFFHLADDDMENLAAALPRLKHLRLGQPCRSNTCNTTVASLVSISVRCLDLIVLETHFNTLTIVDDVRRLLDGGAGRDQAKCKLRSFSVGNMPLQVRMEDIEIIATGFKAIFPCLTDVRGSGGHWQQLKSKLGD